MDDIPNYYDVLGIPRDATDADIKRAYKLLAQVWHPDTNKRADAEERLKEINQARDVLLDPDRRAEHDRELDARAGSGGASDDDSDAASSDDASGDDSHGESEPETYNVKVEPRIVNFGNLRPGGPAVEAEIVLTWDGETPDVRPSSTGGDWWIFHDIKLEPRLGRVTFPIRAEAYSGMAPGKHTSHIDIMVDGAVHRVQLVMTVVGPASKPSPTSSGPSGHYRPPTPSPAPAGFALSDPAKLLAYRMSWLLAMVAVLLISARIEFSALHLAPTSNVLLILLAGWWNIAVVVYGLRRTFRRRRRITIPSQNTALLYSALSVLLLIAGIVVLVYHNGAAAQASPGGQSASVGEQPGSTSSGGGLPETASTVFNVSPTFAAKDTSISGPAEDNAGDSFSVSLTPSLSGFRLDVGIKATYDASQYTAGTTASTLTGQSCMDIKGPATQNGMSGETYDEPPIATNLTDSGGSITGTLEYAAILPGSYSFDFSCLGSNSPDSPLDVGSVTTTNLGISNGNYTADGYNAMTVFAENKSATDTVIIFGAVGSTKDALPPNPGSCIIYNAPQQNPQIARASSVSVYQEKQSNGQWYELGSLTFNLSASQISNGTPAYDAAFFYNCAPGKSANDIISQGGQVILH